MIDGLVAIACAEPSLKARLIEPQNTGIVLQVIQGHRGSLSDGGIEIYQPDLIVDIATLIDDVVALTQIIDGDTYR